nr:cytochrome P450 [Tanacetum cinerariifolium]
IPKLKWRTSNNHVDCGVFAIIHMENYVGDAAKNWEFGLCEKSDEQLSMLQRMSPSRGYRRKKVTGQRGRQRKVTGQRGRQRKVTGGGGCRRKIGSRGGRRMKVVTKLVIIRKRYCNTVNCTIVGVIGATSSSLRSFSKLGEFGLSPLVHGISLKNTPDGILPNSQFPEDEYGGLKTRASYFEMIHNHVLPARPRMSKRSD